MLKKTELQDAVLGWITALSPGTIFYSQDLYRFLETKFPEECKRRGDTSNERRYKNDARWAVMTAKDKRL